MWKNTSLQPGQMYLYGWDRMGRKDELCRLKIVARAMNSVEVEFEDGFRAITSANALKPIPPGYQPQPKLFR